MEFKHKPKWPRQLMNLTCFISIQQLLIVESVRVRVSPDQPRSLRAQTSPDQPRPLRAQTSPTLHYQQIHVSKGDRTDLGSEKASRHGRQVSGKLQWGGGSRKNQEVQEKDQMVREPEQDLHHSPLDRVCRLTHEPPV